MAVISKLGIDDVYKAIKGQYRELRADAIRLRDASAGGAVSFSTVRDYFQTTTSRLAYLEGMVSRYSAAALQAYARAQEEVATYNPAAEYAALTKAITNTLSHIATALPANSAHTVSNGQVVEPSFPTAAPGMQTLRTLLNALIAAIDPP